MNVVQNVLILVVLFILDCMAIGDDQTNNIVIYVNNSGPLDGGSFLVLKERAINITFIMDNCDMLIDQPRWSEPDHGENWKWRHSNRRNHHEHRRSNGWHWEQTLAPPTPRPDDLPDSKTIVASCRQLYENPKYIETSSSHQCNTNIDKMISVLHVPGKEVTGDVSTKWRCEIWAKHNTHNSISVDFIIKVKAGKRLKVEVGQEELIFTETELSQKQYDGLFTYTCKEGQLITLKCSNIYGLGYLKLQYYDAYGAITNNRSAKDIVVLRLPNVKHSTHNGSYFDCTYVKNFTEYPQEFTYRTIFLVEKKGEFKINVNGVSTAQMPHYNNSEGTYSYVYKYIDGEDLSITCEHTNTDRKEEVIMIFSNLSENVTTVEGEKTHSKANFLLKTENLNVGAGVRCRRNMEKSDVILFSADTSRGGNTTVIIICAVVAVVVTIATLCAVYWCKRIRNTRSEENLNQNINQFDNPIPTCPSQWANIDEYAYTYIENEYNYINNEGYLVDNSIYRGSTQNYDYATPQISASSGGVEINPASVKINYVADTNNDKGNPIQPASYENLVIVKNEPPTTSTSYENVHREKTKLQDKTKNNIDYGNLQQKSQSNALQRDSNTMQRNNTKSPVKDCNIRYSNLLRDKDNPQRNYGNLSNTNDIKSYSNLQNK